MFSLPPSTHEPIALPAASKPPVTLPLTAEPNSVTFAIPAPIKSIIPLILSITLVITSITVLNAGTTTSVITLPRPSKIVFATGSVASIIGFSISDNLTSASKIRTAAGATMSLNITPSRSKIGCALCAFSNNITRPSATNVTACPRTSPNLSAKSSFVLMKSVNFVVALLTASVRPPSPTLINRPSIVSRSVENLPFSVSDARSIPPPKRSSNPSVKAARASAAPSAVLPNLDISPRVLPSFSNKIS